MAGSSTASWWQYARWVWLIARNARITEPTGAELTAMRTFVKAAGFKQAGLPNWERMAQRYL